MKTLKQIRENFRHLAVKGMGTETKNSISVGREIDFYTSENGDKREGRVIKMGPKTYMVKDLKNGKTYQFMYHDRARAKDLLKKESVEESTMREKTLTPAEKKKREEIAKAIEKDNPDMPMDKKMAIATATAKRVAEGAKPEFEVKYAKSKRGPIKVTKFMDMASAKKFLDGKKKEGYNGIISKGGKPVKEEVEMTEAVDYFKVAKAFDDYAKKSGGIDKKDFMKVGQFVRQLGKESDVNKQDKTFVAMQKYIRLMDTDPRDGVIQIFQKHGMYKNGRIMREYGGPKISRDEYIKKGKEYHAQKEGVDFFALREKKDSYPLYHKTYSDAMAAAYAYAKKKGYEVDPDDIDRKVATGPRKPSNGKTNSFTLKLKDEKRKMLAVQVTNLDNKRYELNTYIT